MFFSFPQATFTHCHIAITPMTSALSNGIIEAATEHAIAPPLSSVSGDAVFLPEVI